MPDPSSETPAPLRILIGADTFPPDLNGAANFTQRLASGLVERGHEVHVLAPAAGRVGTFVEQFDGQPLTVHRIRSWRWLPHPWLRFMLPWRIRANAERVVAAVTPDVIHFQSHFIAGRGLTLAAEKHHIRLVGTNHTMPENMLQHVEVLPKATLASLARWQWKLAAYWFGKCDEITSPTRRAADYFEQNTGLHGMHAISCGIDMRNYAPSFGLPSENRITFVGRLDEEKYIHELLEALARLDPQLDARVSIVGAGEARPMLERRAQELDVSDRVTFHGRVTDDELRAVLSSSSVFAMPSRAELQSIATLEALATALPVVAADAMALPHLVRPGVNGYLYEPGDIDAFAAHLDTVLRAEPAERERLQRAALEMVAPHDITRTLETFEALYRGVPVDPRS